MNHEYSEKIAEILHVMYPTGMPVTAYKKLPELFQVLEGLMPKAVVKTPTITPPATDLPRETPSTAHIIRKAIMDRRYLHFEYNGCLRKVEALTMGKSTSGKDMLLAYQVDGSSLSGEDSGWKHFKLSNIVDAKIGTPYFRVVPADYRLVKFSRVFCDVSDCAGPLY